MFLNKFTAKYFQLLGKRFNTFYKIFNYLEELDKNSYFILETGTARIQNNYEGDGLSTLLFDEYINYKGAGKVFSVDIDPIAVNFSNSSTSEKTEVSCQDSVQYLYNLSQKDIPKIDLLYLDSYDIEWSNPHPSSMHHIKEMLAIMPKISSGTLIAIDDNKSGVGKGQYVAEFMKNLGKEKYFDEYQIGWIW